MEQKEFEFMGDFKRQEDLELINTAVGEQFRWAFAYVQNEVHANAVRKGFWSELSFQTFDQLFPGKIALVHSELSEALEAHRIREGKTRIAEELADAVIRLMDLAHEADIDLADAILTKHKKNLGRPFKHGKDY